MQELRPATRHVPSTRAHHGAAELPLASYEAFRSADLLAAGVVARMLAGLSTRRYRASLEPAGTAIEAQAKGTSRSAISRRFLRRLSVLRACPWAGSASSPCSSTASRWASTCSRAPSACGPDGVKVPLGLVEGTTENKVVVTDLVTDLRDRGLDESEGLLFVIDGGTALGAAVRSIFGGRALVQRCRRHKERNIVEHLPEAERPLVLRRLRTAEAESDSARAKVALLVIARASLTSARAPPRRFARDSPTPSRSVAPA